MRTLIRRLRKTRRGSNVIEFAMTLPVFLSIVLGIVDFGWFFATQSGIHNAAAIGCREGAMIDPAMGSPQLVATNYINNSSWLWCATGCTITINDLSGGNYAVPNRSLECQITKNFQPLVGFIPLPPIVQTTSQYRFEWQRAP
jgi:Flp pilus assembly protein TadG